MCGITGIISNNTINHILYEALFHIQHRGQDSHGLLTSDNRTIYSIKENGLINKSIKNITTLKGNMGIGHVRYKTSGNLTVNEIQPFIIYNIALCHNGNLSNYSEINKTNLNLQTESDSELILALFTFELKKCVSIKELIVFFENKTIFHMFSHSFIRGYLCINPFAPKCHCTVTLFRRSYLHDHEELGKVFDRKILQNLEIVRFMGFSEHLGKVGKYFSKVKVLVLAKFRRFSGFYKKYIIFS